MDGTKYSEKASYEKSLSFDPQFALAWNGLGVAGGGPEGAGGGCCGEGGVRWPFGGGSPRFVSGVCGEVKRLLFCEGVGKLLRGLCRFPY